MKNLSLVSELLDTVKTQKYLLLGLFFAVSFFLIYRVTPIIVHVALRKRLSTPINARSSHKRIVPAFGGVGILAAMILSISFATNIQHENLSVWMIVSIFLLFGIGFKDDLIAISPRTKFMGQLTAVALVIIHEALAVNDLHGFMGIHEVPVLVTLPIVLFFLLALINAFNLIDGIDGLAGSVAIIILSFLGFYFFSVNDLFFAYVCCGTIGALSAFLIYNMTKGKKKIFLGDCGSLIVGLFLGIACIRFITYPPIPSSSDIFLHENKIPVLLGLLIIPILDTTRVIIIRLKKGLSPFHADRNHLHHVIVDYLGTHIRATAFIALLNFTAATIIIICSMYFSWIISMLCVIAIYFIVLGIISVIHKQNKKEVNMLNQQTVL